MRRVLVANRGEIAVRVIRACFDEGLESVAALSEADLDSLPARTADRTVCLGPAAAAQSYLSVGAVVSAALLAGCDAVHPGYGFLSEQPELGEACAAHGITFVGPLAGDDPPWAGRQGGGAAAGRARSASPSARAPTTWPPRTRPPGSPRGSGYPVLLKAGRGWRRQGHGARAVGGGGAARRGRGRGA